MSTADWIARAGAIRADLARARTRLVSVLFGDYVGLTIFCGILVGLGVTWRQAVFINDNYAVANALVAVAEGHLDLRRAAFGPNLQTPGVFEGADGRPYARNYAQVVLALPVLVLLRGLAAVVDLRVFLLGVWVLLLLWTLRGTGRAVGRERELTIGGGVVGLALFGVGLLFATELPASWLPFLALQVVSAVATGFVGVLGYRLLADRYGRRVGVGGAVAMVFGTTLAFWGTIPKRHVLAACLAMGAAYCLYRSRVVSHGPSAGRGGASRSGVLTRRLGYRAGAYAIVGLVAWLSAPEAIALGPAVLVADVLTSERADWLPRAVLVIGLASALALVPVAATNTVVAGNPFQPPRTLSSYEPSGEAPTGEAPPPATGLQLPLGSIVDQFAGGIHAATQPTRLYWVFVRSQYVVPGSDQANTIAGANLAVLEAAPLFSGLLGFLVLGIRTAAGRFPRAKRWGTGHSDRDGDPVRVVDAFALCYAVMLTLMTLSRLPLHAMINMRYLLPIYPVLAYAVVRLPAVRAAIASRWRWAVWTYAGTLFIGGQLLLAASELLSMTVGESMQAHAAVQLAVAGLVALWAVVATIIIRDGDAPYLTRSGAVLLGLATGLGTVFVLAATVAYLPHAEFLLPVVPAI